MGAGRRARGCIESDRSCEVKKAEKSAKRLENMALEIEVHEEKWQKMYGDRKSGTIRSSRLLDAKALREGAVALRAIGVVK